MRRKRDGGVGTLADHIPVMLDRALAHLDPRAGLGPDGAGRMYVDATVGRGGHAEAILERSSPDGRLVGVDRDPAAVAAAAERLARFGARCALVHGDFAGLRAILAGRGVAAVDGLLCDLGLSSAQLTDPARGFSLQGDGPLDMRMDRSGPQTAADLVNTLSRTGLAKILREYGEESRAGAIAKAIDRARVREPIATTAQLARIVSSVFPPYLPRRIHPATLTFQALRIAVNDETGALQEGLDGMIPLLAPGGRIAVISFHSLEDRIVKQTFAAAGKGCICPPKMPVCSCGKKPTLRVLTKRPLTAGPDEVARNPASRSAKLRAAEKL